MVLALPRLGAGVAVSSFTGKMPETNVPSQVPVWQRLGLIRFPHPRTPPVAPKLAKVDSVGMPVLLVNELPQQHGRVITGRCQGITVRRKAEGPDVVFM